MFQGLFAVKMLLLSNNRIKYIHDNVFANLKVLEWLWLNGNYLKALSQEMLVGLESLKVLLLSDNPLTKLPTDVLNHLPRPLMDCIMLILTVQTIIFCNVIQSCAG